MNIPTTFTNEEIWNLNSSLASLLADALSRLAEGHGYPEDLPCEEWDRLLREAAEDFRAAAEDIDHKPTVGLAFLSDRWNDLWD